MLKQNQDAQRTKQTRMRAGIIPLRVASCDTIGRAWGAPYLLRAFKERF